MRNSKLLAKGDDQVSELPSRLSESRLRVAAVGCGAALAALLLYLLIVPALMRGVSVLRPRVLDLEGARNYYSVIAAAVGSLVGAAGVVTGAYYYFSRLRWEEDRAARERGRARIDGLYERLDEIDELVLSLLFPSDVDTESKKSVYKIQRAVGSLEQLLDAAIMFAGMADEQTRAVVRFYAYLERRCAALLEDDGREFKSVREEGYVIDPGEYGDLLYDARNALHRCHASLQ